jgi:hypothetical protein
MNWSIRLIQIPSSWDGCSIVPKLQSQPVIFSAVKALQLIRGWNEDKLVLTRSTPTHSHSPCVENSRKLVSYIYPYKDYPFSIGCIWKSIYFNAQSRRNNILSTYALWEVAGPIPDGVTGIFIWHNPPGRTMALGLTQPLTEMSFIY